MLFRSREFEKHLTPAAVRTGLAFWAWFAKRPRLYRLATGAASRLLGLLGRAHGRFGWLPLASGWTKGRDFPAPEGKTFMSQFAARRRTS